MLNGKLTICRHGIINEDYITLRIEDEKSSSLVLDAKITLDEFMRALTNLSATKCEFEINEKGLDVWGKEKEDNSKLCGEEYVKPLDEVFQKDDNDDYVITKNGLVYIRTTGNYSGLKDRTTHIESLSSTHLNSIPVQVGSVLSIYTDGEIVASNFMPF